VSLLVTTYQAGKLVLVRDEGDNLNTHFRTFQAPMGMALSGNRPAIGTKIQVWEFVDVPAVTAKLDPPGRHDACFLPRSSHVTGNIQIHEMAWGQGGALWVVIIDPNTAKYERIAELPGFIRGVDFAAGHPPDGRVVAFVGLSQVRERAVFSGIPITERLTEDERTCGVCAIDLTSGKVVTVRDRGAGGFCRDGAAGPAVSGPDQRRRHVAGELVRGARSGARRRIGGAAAAGKIDPRCGGAGR
jgi:Domain of unknown function (DUF4915)